MQNILWLLNRNPVVSKYNVLEYEQEEDYYKLRIEVLLIDGSKLFIIEIFNSKNLNYSYLWQDKSNKMIRRWDNAPHHKNVISYPHHIHTPEIESSFDNDLEKVLIYIQSVIDP